MYKDANFINSAYHNRGSDFFLNGEDNVLNKLSSANFTTVFDVGANLGYWTDAALKAWPQSTVHAFEVAPKTSAKFRDQLAAKLGSGRAILSEHGLSDEKTAINMYYYPNADELTSYSKRHPEHKSVKFTGQLDTLDAYCDKNSIDHIDFLKIDIEGHEFKVIKGGSDRVQNGKVTGLQFEYGAFSTGSRFLVRDYYDLLPDFWLGKVFPNYVAFEKYIWTMENFDFCNYVAIHKSRPDLKDALS